MSDYEAKPRLLHSDEAEQSVLGALLLDNDAIDRIGDLRAEHFFRGDHRTIYASLMTMISDGLGADVITVFERLSSQGKAQELGGLAYLNALAQNTPGASNIGRYAAIVLDRAQKRSLLAVASDIQAAVQSTPDDAQTLIDHAASKLEALAQGRDKHEPKRASEGLSDHLDLLTRRSTGAERVISTGLSALDSALNGGLRPGWQVVLAARPAMGKTALALNLATHMAAQHKVLFLSLEMPQAELHDRNLASLGRIPLETVMRSPENDDDYWQRITGAIQRINDLNLYLDDQGGLSLWEVRMKARAIKRKHGLDVLIIDYLQLMSGKGDNRNEQIAAISRGLKALAKELEISVLCLSQLNRKVEERANRIPQLSDLRDSGSIEQDADAILFLHREEVSNPNCEDQWKGFAQLRLAKFRHSRTGDIPLQYQGEWVTFGTHYGPWPQHAIAPRSRSRGFE